MLTKALLVGLILGLCKMEYFFGYCMICRPIVISTLTGLVLGDPVQGVILGSVLELMFTGHFSYRSGSESRLWLCGSYLYGICHYNNRRKGRGYYSCSADRPARRLYLYRV